MHDLCESLLQDCGCLSGYLSYWVIKTLGIWHLTRTFGCKTTEVQQTIVDALAQSTIGRLLNRN